jgi:spore photoproduct lyase
MTGFSRKLIELFASQDKHLLELKTKSAEVDHLLDLDHKGRTVFAWSINPDKVVEEEELGAEGLWDRVRSAQRCAAAGYPIGFHFDPIIHYPGWEKDYAEVIKLIFDNLPKERIAWISLGALRFPKKRYPVELRTEIFARMQELIRGYAPDVYIYLCMESREVWDSAGIKNQNNAFSSHFRFFEKSAVLA